MKKFLLFLTLFLSAVGIASATETSYIIEFTSATSDGSNAIAAEDLKANKYISAGIDYISSFTSATKVYPGKNGLKLGTGSVLGSFTVSLAKTETVNAQVIPTKIVIKAAKYSSDAGKIKLTINSTEVSDQRQPTSTDLTDYEWEFTDTSALTEAMTSLTIATTEKRAYIKSITVYYDDAAASLVDPAIAWKQGETTLTEAEIVNITLGGEYTIPTLDNPYGVAISYSSSNVSVATFNEDGTIKIEGAGTTVIKAVSAANGTYKSATATFVLNVTDPNNIEYVIEMSDLTHASDNILGKTTAKGFTFLFKKGSYRTSSKWNSTYVQFYAGNTLSITAPAGYVINKIVMPCTTDDYGQERISSSSDNGTVTYNKSTFTNTWSLSAGEEATQTVNLVNNSGKQGRIQKFTIYVKALADDDAGLAFANDTDNATCGTPYTLQTLTNPRSVDVTWSSSNTEVADFKVDGTINIKKAGVTTITATATDAKYTVNNFASYTLTVAKGDPGLAFAAATVNKIVGDAAFTNPLTNDNGLTVTYATEPINSSVATVDANGQVTVKAAGTVKIVASFAGDETYKAGSASYTLTVTDDKKYDTFNASALSFVGESGYRNFTYTGASGAIYGGFADANESTLMIHNQASGNSGVFVSQAPEGYKLGSVTVFSTTGDNLTLYANNKPYSSVSTDGKEIGNFGDGEQVALNLSGFQSNMTLYGLVPTTFCIFGNSSASSVTEIKVVWEPDTRADAGIAFAEAAVSKAFSDESFTFTNKLTNTNSLAVTYSTDPAESEVATVDANSGEVTVKAAGTVTIVATSAETADYKPGTASYTITVAKQYVYADTKVTLVKDANTLNPGDIIVIANQDASVAMSTSSSNATKRGQTDVTLSPDKSEITYLPDNALLLELHQVEVVEVVENKETTSYYWTLNALNFSKEGVLYCSTSSNDLKLGVPQSTNVEKSYAKIAINGTTGEATILLNKGTGTSDSNKNLIMYNDNSDNGQVFSCYNKTQKPVYIYKVETPTTIDTADEIAQSFVATPAGKNNEVKLTYQILTESTVEKFAIVINGVTTDVVSNVENIIDIALSGVPYLPDANITICPVLAEDAEGKPTTLGHPEKLEFTWADINSYGLVDLDPTLVWIGSDADPLPATATLGANCNFGLNIPGTVANLNYYVDVEAKDADSGEAYEGEFSWTELGFCYSINPYITGVPVDTKNKSLELDKYTGEFPTITCYVTPIYKFDVAEQYRSLLTTPATPRPARVASTITDGVQTVVCDVKDAQVNLGVGSQVSGVEGVTVDGGAAVEYFNLQGVRVDGDLAPGIYIRRQGQSVSKVRIN